MNSYWPIVIECGACGEPVRHDAVRSTTAVGLQDLDTRPPPEARYTLRTQVQRCPSCGYCAENIRHFDENLRETLHRPKYRSQLESARHPELARSFLCAGMLAEASSRDGAAGWYYLKAAWALDDTDEDELARDCRLRAAYRFITALGKGETFSEQPEASEVILVDCLRRAGRFEKASQLIK